MEKSVLAITFVCTITAALSYAVRNFLIPDVIPPTSHLHPEAGPFFETFFKVYVPRRVCMLYEPVVVWLHFISDFLIALSYFSIPIALIVFIRKRKDVAFSWIFLMFAAFILLCGTTHVIGMWDLWEPMYKIDGVVKAITALVSVATALSLWPLIPKALAMPSPAMLEERVKERTAELAQANAERQVLLDRETSLRDAAEKANLLKDEFLATLSHELRTPLNAILGWSQIIRKKTQEGVVAEGLAIIERNSRLQVTLIEDLLDMSSIVSGKLHLRVGVVNLTQVAELAIESILPAAQAKKIRIEKHITPSNGSFWGDPARLQQVFWNLLSNVVKFTPENGLIEVSVKYENESAVISVKDSGVGITKEFLPLLFNRFSQADSSSTRAFGGLGLGLAICRNLVEMYGGSITAQSEGKHRGATFLIKLPLRGVDAGAVSSEPNNAPSQLDAALKAKLSQKKIKVLIVDDQPDSLLLSAAIISNAGMIAFTALDAVKAMEILQREKPDILISDIGMPNEDGYGLLKRIRDLPSSEGGSIPAIALSAFADAESKKKCREAGYAIHIAKPFDHEELILAINKIAP